MYGGVVVLAPNLPNVKRYCDTFQSGTEDLLGTWQTPPNALYCGHEVEGFRGFPQPVENSKVLKSQNLKKLTF